MVWNSPKWSKKRDRNLEICLLIESGCTQLGVASKFGVTRQRVHQIWHLYLRHKNQCQPSFAEERHQIQSLFLSPAASSNLFGRQLPRRLHQSGISSAQLEPRTYRDLMLAAEPQELGAVARQQ